VIKLFDMSVKTIWRDEHIAARQSATVTQTANTSGSNSSSVAQSLTQDENASASGAITQRQNTASTALTGPNQEANIMQATPTGNNSSGLNQSLSQHQAATSGDGSSISQTQGTAFFSGQKGTVSQTISMPSAGVNSSTPTQNENQKQEASTTGSVAQVQIGPEDCCSTQIGGTTANVNNVVQSNAQQNQTGGASQSSVQRGRCSEDSGANCSLDQTYQQNGNPPIEKITTGTGVVANNHNCTGATGCTDTNPIE